MTNRSWTWGIGACAVALVAVAGCKKKEESAPAPTTAAAAPVPPPPAAPAAPAPAPDPNAVAAPAPGTPPAPGEVKRYPNETPVGHTTVRAVVPFIVYQEADLISQKLGTVAQGTFVNVMATYSNWILVEWPSGVGELSPGWAPIPNIYDRRLAMATADERERVERERAPNRDRPKVRIRPNLRNDKNDKK